MSANIHITSFELLRRLEAVIGIFSEDVTDKIQSVGQNTENYLASIENRCQELEREISYWESEYEQASNEENDTGYLAYKCQEAGEKLYRTRNLQKQAEEASENFARCARRVNAITDERMNNAKAFLRQKIKELQDYANVQPESNDFTVSLSSATLHSNSAADDGEISADLSLSKSSPEDLMKIPLPKGFKWIPLEEISQKEISELPDESQFIKVSYDEMKKGLERFEREILPVLRRTPDKSDAVYFEDLDMKNENDEINGVKKIFNVFFDRQVSKEFIKVERFAGDSKYDITNGRHRIKVARDLGWQVIPAEATEVDWKK